LRIDTSVDQQAEIESVLGLMWGLVKEVCIYACVTWLIYGGRDIFMCDMTHPWALFWGLCGGLLMLCIYMYVWHDSYMGHVTYSRVTWLNHERYSGAYEGAC